MFYIDFCSLFFKIHMNVIIIYFSLTVQFWCSFLYFQSIKSTQWNSSLNWIEIQPITGGFWSQISENKKKSKSQFTEIKICHFWEFHKSWWINKRHKSRVRRIKKIPQSNHSSSAVWRQRKLWLPQSQIMKKNGEREIRNAWVAVKRGV